MNEVFALSIKVYPNPTSDFVTIETRETGPCFIKISSLNGQILYSMDITDPIFQVDLSSFRKGIYFITVRSQDFVTTRKVIKLGN